MKSKQIVGINSLINFRGQEFNVKWISKRGITLMNTHQVFLTLKEFLGKWGSGAIEVLTV